MSFKLIILKYKKLNPYLNMAIDEANLLYGNKDEIILRFFGWEPYSVSIGTFQKIEEINIDFLKENKIPLVRRPTGGKGVYHENELTYSIVIPKNHPLYELSIIESYKEISKVFIFSLIEFGIKGELTKKSGEIDGFCFSSLNYYEVSVNGKKIIGSAQRRKKEGLLQQGSIPIEIDYEKVKNIFYLEDTSKFTSLKELNKSIEIDILEEVLIKNFINFFSLPYEIIEQNNDKISIGFDLFKNKYSLESWNYRGVY
ncbi:MAG: lipoate--protein ligase family protein [Caldisericia bacterium]|nr:lipoate--protein ligase family protein [Caldisericia bacterium]